MLLVAFLVACPGPTPGGASPCDHINERLGDIACLHHIPEAVTFSTISSEAEQVDQVRATKHMVPLDLESAVIPSTFVNSNLYALHSDLLEQEFAEEFPGINQESYSRMVLADDRDWLSGNVIEFAATTDYADGYYGFTIWDDFADDAVTVTYEEVLHTYEQMTAHVLLQPMVWVPLSSNQWDAANSWEDPPFEIKGIDDNVAYEAYTQAVGYGSVRLHNLTELEELLAEAAIGFQDIVILDEAPFDLDRVVGGIVTGTRQGTLSHLNVRTAARGTPNCYIRDAHVMLEAWQDQLVRFECADDNWTIQSATQEEAEAFWESIRPDPVVIPAPDYTTTALQGLLALPTDSEADRAVALSAYGSKGTNLATLYQRIPVDLQLQGFVVPFHHYGAFMAQNSWTWDGSERTFDETVEAWLADPEFISDGALRFDRLEALRAAMEAATVDAVVLDALAAEIRSVWGDDDTMVRFRSSSNAEDDVAFSGAGLYDSESACLADELDDDTVGPSLCDPDKDDEHTLSQALTKVWASVWSTAAYEERDWYGIDHAAVAMGVLVNDRSKDEQVNAVAFTGDPSSDDDRYLVNAQLGTHDVVATEPGVYPETDLLDMQDGSLAEIVRVEHSSLLDSGWVLSDSQLETLGEALWDIVLVYPVDGSSADVLLDTEWKVLEDGRLIVKQVRPFAR